MRGRSCPGEEGSISSSTSLELSARDGVPGVSGEDGTAYASTRSTTISSVIVTVPSHHSRQPSTTTICCLYSSSSASSSGVLGDTIAGKSVKSPKPR